MIASSWTPVATIEATQARTLAEVLVHQIRGGSAPEPYRGLATCYIEFGGAKVARFDANFLSGPTPFGSFTPASEDIMASKVEFGASRRPVGSGHVLEDLFGRAAR